MAKVVKLKWDLICVIVEFPLGMVLEVDDGDEVSSAIVVELVDGGEASKAGVRAGDCVRGIRVVDDCDDEDGFVTFDGVDLDAVMDILVNQRGLGPLGVIIERWCV
eukprot:CAMPEP_0194397726 /NCGR_PEP_ID=MMETSP0174-20130528/125703_1 /TAXON_ID=216777 /ORGANISM="Proboscia alata, Strain PI-D3" /LENGTH=105 /DNA_ID=CAMNT_0039193933 /DNA_START=966 /DNA_END=1283 /DNA_ORIENTATION=-